MVTSSNLRTQLADQQTCVDALQAELNSLKDNTPEYEAKLKALDAASCAWKRLHILSKRTPPPKRNLHQQTLGDTIDLTTTRTTKTSISTPKNKTKNKNNKASKKKRGRSSSPTASPSPKPTRTTQSSSPPRQKATKQVRPSSILLSPSPTPNTTSATTKIAPTSTPSTSNTTASKLPFSPQRASTPTPLYITKAITPTKSPSGDPNPSTTSTAPLAPTTTSPPSYASAASLPPPVSHHHHQVRFRFTVHGFLHNESQRRHGHSTVIAKMLSTLHHVDPDAQLLPWNQTLDSRVPPIAPTSTVPIPDSNCLSYINSPNGGTYLKGRDPTYRQGVRFSSAFPVHVFLDKWNIARKTVPGSYVLSPAENQHHHSSSIVGFCQGSTEKKDISVLRDTLPELTGIPHLDLSWQNVSLGKHNATLWRDAKDIANQEFGDQPTSQWKHKKFAHSPRALVIYAPTSAEAETARRILYQHYGKTETGNFPQWPDGSRMKFLPLDEGFLPSSIADRILPRMKWHIFAKANEVSTPLPHFDPWQHIGPTKESIGSFLHNVTTPKGIPVFRHITHRWTRNPEHRKWNVTVSSHMEEVARTYLGNLSTHLHTKYGDDVLPILQEDTPTFQAPSLPSDLGKYYNTLNDDLIQENLLEPGFACVIYTTEMVKFGGIDSDITIGKPTSISAPDDTTIPSIDSPSVSTNASRSVHFDESEAQRDLETIGADRLQTLFKQFNINNAQFQDLQRSESMLWDFASNCSNTSWKCVHFFLRNLQKTNKLPSDSDPHSITGAAAADRSPEVDK